MYYRLAVSGAAVALAAGAFLAPSNVEGPAQRTPHPRTTPAPSPPCSDTNTWSCCTRRTTASTTCTAVGAPWAVTTSTGCRTHRGGTPPRSRRTAPCTDACSKTTSTSPPPTAGHVQRPRARHLLQQVRQQAVHDRPLHRSHRQDLPGAGRLRPQRRAEGQPGRIAGRLHARPGPPVLPGAVPDQRRHAEPLRHRFRRGGAHHGHVRHPKAAHLPLPALAGRPALRHRRPLLPGCPRRLVPEPPVADRRARAHRQHARGARGRRHSVLDANGMPTSYPQYVATDPDVVDGELTRACPGGATAQLPTRLRRLRGQHGPAVQPARRRHRREDRAHQRQAVPQHRRPALRQEDHLELVLRRLGRRGRRTSGPAVPVPPPAVQLLRGVRPGTARSHSPPGRDRLLQGRADGTPADRQLRQAVRRRERAPRLRERDRGETNTW